MRVAVLNILVFYISDIQSADPCEEYISANDTEMSTAYEAEDIDSIQCQSITPLKWFRYTGTFDGRMADSCPSGLQCGSHTHIWFNDTLPTIEDGEVPKRICSHTNSTCCTSRNTIRTKNCSEFIIYFLIPVPNCASYCFASTKEEVIPNPFFQTGSNKSLHWLWIILPVVLGIAAVLALFVRKKLIRGKISGEMNMGEAQSNT